MNRFRIGNDIAIKWTITRGDEAEDLTRVIVKKVYIVCPNWETELQYRIEGDDNNVLVLLFSGKEQKYCGPYWLRLEENPGEDNMNVIESQPMFMLRPVTDGAAIMPVAVTELATNVMLPQNGLSAYDIAVIHGYEGTEEEWAARTEDDHTRAEDDHTRAEEDHTRAASDHTTAASDHTQALSDHTQALSDKSQAASDHTRAASDHTTATSDHTQASNDHTRAESDHSTASEDHSTASEDHVTATADHTQASNDHTRAESDHTTASADHTTATSDHTTAAADHTQAESDHTTASADHTNALEDRDNAITSTEVHYAEGTSATDAPTTGWQSDLPTVAAGNYLWSRITITFGDESTKVLYNRSVVPTVTLTEDQVTHLVTLAVGGSAFTPKLVSETKLTELATKVEAKYAKKDGYYESLTVGRAENLVDTKGNGTPQTFTRRTSAGTDSIENDGTANIKQIKGNTIVWNQLQPIELNKYLVQNVSKGTLEEYNGYGFKYIFTGVANDAFSNKFKLKTTPTRYGIDILANHQYLLSANIYTPHRAYFSLCYGTDYGGSKSKLMMESGWNKYTKIVSYITDTAQNQIGVNEALNAGFVEGEYYIIDKPMCIDLTLMFGAGNEPSTVKEFEALFPNDYYEYNAGELVSFNGTGIKTVGFNAFNVDTGKAVLLGGNQYQISGTYTSVSYVDIDGNSETLTITNGLFTPNNNGTLTVVGGDNTTCVHLTWSGYRNGEYEPYWDYSRNFPISSIMYSGSHLFPNGLCSAGEVYDEITPTKAIKRVDVVDLGSLNWVMGTLGGVEMFYANLMNSPLRRFETICEKYPTFTGVSLALLDKTIMGYGNTAYGGFTRFGIRDTDYTDAETLKTSLNGVMAYYELAEPIEVDLVGVNLSYKVSDFGTEEIVPQGVGGDGVPLSSPFVADIIYQNDFTRELVNLQKNYQSQDSMDAMLEVLGSALGFTWSKNYDTTNKKWTYTVTANQPES